MKTPDTPYQAGVCNINPTEIAYRRKAGYAGVAITLAVALPLLFLDVNRFVRLIVWLPAFLAAISFLQAKNRFCVAYASSGMQNAGGNSLQGAAKVSAADHLKDQLKAKKMYIQAAGIATVAALLLILVP